MLKKSFVIILTVFLYSCAAESPFDRTYVSNGIRERTNFVLGDTLKTEEFLLPEGVLISDGLTQDEAVTIALWNNAQFQADLASLGFARAELIEASLLPNPVFSILFPVGPKQLESKLKLPIDFLWQRPNRITMAKLDAERIAKNLMQNGLGLIKDVQFAFSNLIISQKIAKLCEEKAKIYSKIAELEQTRLKAGDISELEASNSKVEAIKVENESFKLSNGVDLIRYRLMNLLGIQEKSMTFSLITEPVSRYSQHNLDELIEMAYTARPDLRAAELKIERAGKLLGWERSRIFNLIGIIDGKDKGEENLTIGPGGEIELPLFNRNNGGTARAHAEISQAAGNYIALKHKITLEVQEAVRNYELACKEYEIWHSEVIPTMEKTLFQAEKANNLGEKSYLYYLLIQKKLVDGQIREAELEANLRKSITLLNYAVGKKIED